MKAALIAALVLFITCLSGTAIAHGMRSAYLELSERTEGETLIRVRVTVDKAMLDLSLEGCTLSPTNQEDETDTGLVRSYLAHCDGGLAGRRISVTGMGGDVEEVATLAVFADGTSFHGVMLPNTPALTLPTLRSSSSVALDYVRLGLEHIAGGLDHLLFLVLLVLQLRTLRDVLLAETAFTIAHGLSFSATALGWIRVQPAPTEACIALSLLLLALDCRPGEKLPGRYGPAVLALVFGLVHGLGFAGGLREVGVPEASIGAALLGFAAGVELGQIAIVLAMVGLLRLGQGRPRARWVERVFVIGGGGLAMYWLVCRSWQVFVEV